MLFFKTFTQRVALYAIFLGIVSAHAQTFTSEPIKTVFEGETYNYNIITVDATTVTAPTLPSWLTLKVSEVQFTLAGSGNEGNSNGIGTAATFNGPTGVVSDDNGNTYICDSGNYVIRKITAEGEVSTFAGSGIPGFQNGTGTAASFNVPWGITMDSFGNLYVTDAFNYAIRKITPEGVVSTFAGNGQQGYQNGTGGNATFNYPYGIAIDNQNNLYVSESGNNCIRKITSGAVVTTFAGSRVGNSGFQNGTGTGALFAQPYGVSVDMDGNLYVGDSDNNVVRKITPEAVVTTFAGSGAMGSANGPSGTAQFYLPQGTAVDNLGNVYVADSSNGEIRVINNGQVSTLIGGLNMPYGVFTHSSGTLYFTNTNDNTIGVRERKVTLAGETTGNKGMHSIVLKASNGTAFNKQSYTLNVENITPNITPATTKTAVEGEDIINDITGTNAINYTLNVTSQHSTNWLFVYIAGEVATVGNTDNFNKPSAIAMNGSGVKYIVDSKNNTILQQSVSGTTTVFAGSGLAGSSNGTGTAASFNTPQGVAISNEGVLYIADSGNNLIRKISPDGIVTTLAGSGTAGSTDGVGTAASFNNPFGIAVDADENVYVSDASSNSIRKITSDGIVTTLVSGRTSGFNAPLGIAVDNTGTVYVVDSNNYQVKKVSSTGLVSVFAGSGTQGTKDGKGTAASFFALSGITIDALGFLYVTDDQSIRRISPEAEVNNFAGSLFSSGYQNGYDHSARMLNPLGVTVDNLGYVYVADTGNKLIRNIQIKAHFVGDGVVKQESPGNYHITLAAVNALGKVSKDTFTLVITPIEN